MRLSYQTYNILIELSEGRVCSLCVENPQVFSLLISELWKQFNGGEGGWILSEKEKILQISKLGTGIFNPFSLDCNEKKIVNKIYLELQERATSECITKIADLNGEIIELLDELFDKVPYGLEMNPEMDLLGLFKLFDVKMETENGSLLERIVNYLRAMHAICKMELFVFVNLKQFLSTEECQQLYEFIAYEKLFVFLLEGVYKSDKLPEKCWIFDNDLCMIEVKS